MESVTVTDALPAGLTATAISGTGWTCTLGSLSCNRTDALGASASYAPVTVTVNVAANAPASVTNNATVSGGGELNTANDSASDPTTIGNGPDLIVTKTHSGNFTQGQTGAQYTITVKNTGGSPNYRGGNSGRHAARRPDSNSDQWNWLDLHSRHFELHSQRCARGERQLRRHHNHGQCGCECPRVSD